MIDPDPDATRDDAPAKGEPGFWAVIPAGGSGTRLWPLSRSARPKFLLPLLGRRSLLQETVHRLGPLVPPERTFVVCGPAHAAPVARQLPALPESHVLVETSPKGSGPAIALAAAIIERIDPDAVMGSFAADHEVAYEDAFAAGFAEKPSQATAERFVASGSHLWNASMFVWQVATLMAELERLQPDLARGVRRVAAVWGTPEQDTVAAEVWSAIEESTIDQGVMERADRIAVVPADLGWSDVGDWHGLGELIANDPYGNAVRGDVVQADTRNSVVWSETGRLIALVGLENIAVVDTDDALLVINRDAAQEVRRIVDQLKQLRRTSYQ